MKNLSEIKQFLGELRTDKALVFNLEKINSFERALFLSTQSILIDKYNVRLGGLSYGHQILFLATINEKNILVENDIQNLVETSFEIYNIINARNVTLGYGSTKSTSSIDNENLNLLISSISKFIELFEKIE
ncbi:MULTISPECIES: hypothetical protein [Bacillus cereus group]|uniref:HEPN domain-containing protein n=1 Tax=Bacillus wiedmannii TaxID=1890302 RepID=A0ABX5DPP0_9BACI|nr:MULTISPECIES: hypothetical protein [Bacillus cereus group]MED2984196.1 hypothetical protein [Bacillus thuringiensis]MRB56193.1 hypothetical protein [Bacillus thuringiensis]PEV32857.1 hypothetical protein CN420_02420 [Bacillus thuringiensis]PRT38295.1 hypothetical protein C6357_21445 [Bacillus wiedmannii]